MSTKHLGKIESVHFGRGGYQEAMFGLDLSFTFDKCCGIGTSDMAWNPATSKRSERAEWTEEDRGKQLEEIMRRLAETLHKAKVKEVYELKGIPVEIEIEGNTFKSWRVLTEVL